jgi:hypothetical protein
MEWEFTPEDVLEGKVAYGLAEFRNDLIEEVRLNLPPNTDATQAERVFGLTYDLCYWLATGRELADFERDIGADPYLVAFVRAMHRYSGPNVEMLGAILQRGIMNGVEAGLSLEDALKEVADQHARVTADRKQVF